MPRGNFIFWPGESRQLIVPNTVTLDGEESYLKMIFQNNDLIVAGGGNFYVGMCDENFDKDYTLADLTGEPTVGYARVANVRSSVGWPTVEPVGESVRVLSQVLTFTATDDWDSAVSRAFLCNVISGTSGILFGVSGLLPIPLQLNNAQVLPLQYEVFLR